ncbi:hypothetical protein VE02_01078 [Pseudogymnoascus sp. 03VT05]|nr:hypothetical protein VE02_01078 [Pseudogymnoascus sp. 03VT05]
MHEQSAAGIIRRIEYNEDVTVDNNTLLQISLPLRQRSPHGSPAHHSPIQLPPLGADQRAPIPELRRRRTHWDLSTNTRDDGVADYAQDPFSAHDMRGPLSANAMGASAREYYHHMGEDRRHSYHDGMMRPRHIRQPSPPTPHLFRSGSRDSIATVDPVSPSTPRDALPEYGYPVSRNASFSSMGPGSMYPDPTQFEPGSRNFDAYAKQTPLPRFPGTLPAPHGVPMHAHHYHEQHYHDPAMAAYAASQGHMIPQIPAFAPPPATTVTASGTKRYHCRYADAVGCEKTFTTSGHASRHSKIHTCEKGIQCAFPGCLKKFTRADNMKQHLETHYKDSRRPRPSTSSSGSGGPGRRGLRKGASSAAVAMRREGRGLSRDMVRLQARQMEEVGRWPNRVVRGESSGMGAREDQVGLDALAAAVEHEEGGGSVESEEGTPGPGRL